ncbi:MAG: two-component system response regulator [Planctomycetota bacterium]|nr:MAG: two-component system response regulator [Planctomycetota bacterium]
MSSTPIQVLLVEDNPGDVRLTREALRESKVRNQLNAVNDGEEAIAFLRRSGRYGEAPRPDLILLDLNMPRKNGREVLAELKSDGDFQQIPVIVLTSSDSERDVSECYELNANSYVRKPVGLDQFFEVIAEIERYWMGVNRLPGRTSNAK